MAKRSTKYISKATSEQNRDLLMEGIKIYPVYKFSRWFIEVDNNGKIKTFDKSIKQNEIPESIDKTILFYYNKLIDKKNGK